jgi:uncharacterized protein DUF1488
MALMRGTAVGYDADKMCFRFTMTDGLIAIDCEVSNAALVELGGSRWKGGYPDHAAHFAEYRAAIEEIASKLYDAQTDRKSSRVRIFSKHVFKSKK